MHFLVFYKHLRLEDLKFAREIPVSIFKNLFCTRFEPELSRFFELTRMFSSSAGASVFLVVKGTCVNNLKVWMKLLIQRPRAWIGGDLAINTLGWRASLGDGSDLPSGNPFVCLLLHQNKKVHNHTTQIGLS